MAFRIVLEKDDFKFSVSHFTIFGPGIAEPLHGHNYYLVVEIGVSAVDAKLGMAFDFNLVKPMIRELTKELDEHVLLPAQSTLLKIVSESATEGEQISAIFGHSHYRFPKEDVLLLPVVNITSEELAKYLAERILKKLRAHPDVMSRLTSFSLGLQETRGQTVFFDADLS